MIKKLLASVISLALALFAATVFAAVEVNTATPAELDSVKGIGPAISAKIVDARKNGPFKDWEDLVSRVKGIGEKNSAEFSAAGLTVNGSARSSAPAAAAAPKKSAAKPSATTTPPATTTAAPTPPSATPAAPVTAGAAPATTPPMTAADKKAAARQEREDKKAAKKAAKAASSAAAASSPGKK